MYLASMLLSIKANFVIEDELSNYDCCVVLCASSSFFFFSMPTLCLTVLFQILFLLFCHCFVRISPWKMYFFARQDQNNHFPVAIWNSFLTVSRFSCPKVKVICIVAIVRIDPLGQIICHLMLYITTVNTWHNIIQKPTQHSECFYLTIAPLSLRRTEL